MLLLYFWAVCCITASLVCMLINPTAIILDAHVCVCVCPADAGLPYAGVP
jgi:hypothetical protein